MIDMIGEKREGKIEGRRDEKKGEMKEGMKGGMREEMKGEMRGEGYPKTITEMNTNKEEIRSILRRKTIKTEGMTGERKEGRKGEKKC